MLTRIFSAARRPPKRLDRATARACLMTNLAVLPGLGSLLAGRRVGMIQMVFGLIGSGLFIFWLLAFARAWMQQGIFPRDGGPHPGCGKWGLTIGLIGSVWSVATSLSVLREIRKREKPPDAKPDAP